jgi:hypothetical protein
MQFMNEVLWWSHRANTTAAVEDSSNSPWSCSTQRMHVVRGLERGVQHQELHAA